MPYEGNDAYMESVSFKIPNQYETVAKKSAVKENGDGDGVTLSYTNTSDQPEFILVVAGHSQNKAKFKTDGELLFQDRFRTYSAVGGSAYCDTSFHFVCLDPGEYAKSVAMNGIRMYKLSVSD